MANKEEITSYLKEHGYKMTMVSGAYQLWSHLVNPDIWLKSSGNVQIYVEIDFERVKEKIKFGPFIN